MFFLLFLIEGFPDPDLIRGSGCGSGRPKNIWILLRIRISHTVPLFLFALGGENVGSGDG
jgi:hypothetical protein